MKISYKKIFYLTIILFLFVFGNIPTKSEAAACNIYNSAQSVPANFGAAFNVHSQTKETLIDVSCNAGSADVTVGNGYPLQYIYNKGRIYNNGTWQQVGINAMGSTQGSWIIGQGKVNIPITSSQLGKKQSIVFYICNYINNQWKCGCRDNVCSSDYWQLQQFIPPLQSCADKDGDGYGSPATGCVNVQIDCDDNEYWANPGNKNETCDTIDNDCNGQTDEFCDKDKDGYCDKNLMIYRSNSMCPKTPAGNFVNGYYGDDCSDNNFNINPGKSEICDGLDNDCDSGVDEDLTRPNNDDPNKNAGVCINSLKTCQGSVGWKNDYSAQNISGYESIESSCNDALDNDCDAKADLFDSDCGSLCIEDWQCTSWTNCISNTQNRICSDNNNCGTTVNKPIESQGCISCSENWTCTAWSACDGSTQTRTCADKNNCSTTANKPAETQSCSTICADSDKDGFGSPASATCVYSDLDCNDSDYDIKPGVYDFCSNGIDENCDGFDNNCSSLNVNIATPINNTDFKIDSWFNSNGAAIGGKAPYIFRWSSDKDGYLGEGEWFSYKIPITMNLGEHIITLEVEDANGIKSTDAIKININSVNTLTANLNFWKYKFANGEWLSWGVNISGGTAPYSINWTSDLMGAISNDQWVNIDTAATPWTAGEHLIQAVVQDASGDTVILFTMIKIANISLNMWPENASTFYSGDTIWFSANVIGGTGQYNYTWTSDKDGLLRDSGSKSKSFDSFQNSSLSEGIHNIELEVTYDTNKTISKNIQIQINPIDPSLVACFDFTDCDDGDSCTDEVCDNPATISASCSNPLKTSCQNNDACCPGACNSTNDNDCIVSADNDDPAKVLVIYNKKCNTDNNKNGISDYTEIALYYQQKRNIPDSNMLGIEPFGSTGCVPNYGLSRYSTNFIPEVLTPIRNKLATLGENNIYYFALIGMPYTLGIDTSDTGSSHPDRSIDQALMTFNDIDSPLGWPYYWDYVLSAEYPEKFYGATLIKPRFNHSFKYNGNEMYLVTRIHDKELIDRALYGEKYIYNSDGYYRGRGYVDTRYNKEFTNIYLDGNYSIFSDLTSYAKGNAKMAYGKRIFEIEGWDYKWEYKETEIGEVGAIFSDGTSAELISDALWYEGWYNFGKYHDVWTWKTGAVACDLNSNSGRVQYSGMAFLKGAFANGLTAGTGVLGEPYLNGHPAPEVLMYYILNGYNFAEASNLSYPGFKWKDIAYGDPLYNPLKTGKTAVKDVVLPELVQVIHEANTLDTSSSTYIVARINMNKANPEVATYKLEYGLTAAYGTEINYDEIYSSEKKFLLSGLEKNSTYHYRVAAKDPVGNIIVGADNIFKTSSDKSILPGTITVAASVNIGNAPLAVDFTSSFSVAPSSFKWNFADGNTSSDQNPNHIFNKGFYKVMLQAEFPNGLSESKELLIIAK